MSIDYEAIKEGQRAMWGMGDFSVIARRTVPAGELLAERLGARAGIELLDVATGSGNVALSAAQRGASATGLDIAPGLLEAARRRARELGLHAQFVEGDAEALPFADASFDRVGSTFGVMFAPRHRQAARELLRVTRPGGMIGVAAWTPEGLIGRFFKLTASFMPPPPPELQPPVLWGTEEHVRELLGEPGVELEFEHHAVVFDYDSAEAVIEEDEQMLGPAIMAKAALEPQGRYQELRTAMIELYESVNEDTTGRFRARADYLLSLARLPA